MSRVSKMQDRVFFFFRWGSVHARETPRTPPEMPLGIFWRVTFWRNTTLSLGQSLALAAGSSRPVEALSRGKERVLAEHSTNVCLCRRRAISGWAHR